MLPVMTPSGCSLTSVRPIRYFASRTVSKSNALRLSAFRAIAAGCTCAHRGHVTSEGPPTIPQLLRLKTQQPCLVAQAKRTLTFGSHRLLQKDSHVFEVEGQ